MTAQGVLSPVVAATAAPGAASGMVARWADSQTLRGISKASASASEPGTSGSAYAATRFT